MHSYMSVLWFKLESSCTNIIIQGSPSLTDTTETKDFVFYSEVCFAQGVIVDHTPLIIVDNIMLQQDNGL